MNIKCFMLEETDKQFQWLRRYNWSNGHDCKHSAGHDALARIEDASGSKECEDWPRGDERWPKKCDHCDYVFPDTDQWQLFTLRQYKRSDNGELCSLHPNILPAPAGAMWYATWMEGIKEWLGPDGKVLVVKTPGGDWIIDSKASNCTMPDEHVHRCWVRHGTPPEITVDKNGNTCNAGGGSIQSGPYHGFLRNGFLVDA